MRIRHVLFSVLFALAIAPCAWGDTQDMWKLYEQRNFFALHDRLPPPVAQERGDLRFLRAATDASFGRHAISIALLQQILAAKPNRDLEVRARRLLMGEERGDFRYVAALGAIEPLLHGDPSRDDRDLADLRNSARLLKSLEGVAPQELDRGKAPVALQRGPDGRFPVTINGHETRLAFDSGAGFSFLAASVARKAGLKTRQVDVSLGSSTGVSAGADIAVGDVTIGSSRIRNVVFLILPDAGLTMPDGFFMPGLLGFPVMTALGPIRYGRDGSIRIGENPLPGQPNLALEGNHVLLRIAFRNSKLLCRLDTGADNTVFYEPFYRHFPELFTQASRRHMLKLGGVSGAHDIAAYRLASIDVMLAGKPVHLTATDVLEKPIENPEDNYLACNIGMDALKSFKSYTIDLKALRLNLDDGR
jgi:hypothetical protein